MVSSVASFRNTRFEKRLYRSRLLMGLAFVAVLMLLIIGRYIWLQVYQYNYYVGLSERNRSQLRPLVAARGAIYARNKELIASNFPRLDVVLIPELIKDVDATLYELSQLIDIEADDIKRFKVLLSKSPPSTPVPLGTSLDDRSIGRLAVNRYRLPGVEINANLVRYYPYNNLFSHVVGYIGAINTKERRRIAERNDNNYRGSYNIGKVGVERRQERQLHGHNGYQRVEVNAQGHSQSLLQRQSSVRGQDLNLNLDIDVQRAARNAMRGRRGAVVALDVSNGGVVAMVSSPDFDPNDFIDGSDPDAVHAARSSPDKPLFNRALAGQYAPASTFKPIVALAALENKYIDEYFVLEDVGYYVLGDRVYYDWNEKGHNKVRLHKALVESCDVYFYHLGGIMGSESILSMAGQFGFGIDTGVDLYDEATGLLPSNDWKILTHGDRWYGGDTINLSIGQGYVLATPLQLASMMMIIANKGNYWKPQLLHSIGDYTVVPELIRQIDLSENVWTSIHNALVDVVHDYRGTAHNLAKDLGYTIASKTGTAQIVGLERKDANADNKKKSKKSKEALIPNEDGVLPRPKSRELKKRFRDHAIFVAYAPAEQPTLAVAVVVENGEFASSVAGPVARAVFDAWLK